MTLDVARTQWTFAWARPYSVATGSMIFYCDDGAGAVERAKWQQQRPLLWRAVAAAAADEWLRLRLCDCRISGRGRSGRNSTDLQLL